MAISDVFVVNVLEKSCFTNIGNNGADGADGVVVEVEADEVDGEDIIFFLLGRVDEEVDEEGVDEEDGGEAALLVCGFDFFG